MLRTVSIALCIALIMFATTTMVSATKRLKSLQPSPQAFTVSGAEKAGLILGMTQTGAISLAVEWTGPALTMELYNGKGALVKTLAAVAGPHATLSYTAVDTDLKADTAWVAILRLAAPDTNAKATGKFTVTLPDFKPVDLTKGPMAEAITKARTALDAKVKARIQAFEQEKTTARTAIAAKFTTAIQQCTVTQQALQATRKTTIDTEMTTLLKVNLTALTTPYITACSVREAGPRDPVTLTGVHFGVETVRLEIPDQTPITVPMVQSTGGTEMRFAMPTYAVTAWTKAYFSLKGRTAPFPNGTEYTSNKVPVWLKPSMPLMSEILPAGPQTGSPSEGQPGTPLLITGTGIDPNGQVRFKFSATDDRAARTEWVSEYQVKAYIPDPGPIANPITVQMYLVAYGNKSAPKSIVIKPDIEMKALPFTDWENDSTWKWGDCVLPADNSDPTVLKILQTYFIATTTVPPGPVRREDQFYQSRRLKNNWVVEAVDLSDVVHSPGREGASLQESPVGTDSPSIKVLWMADLIPFTSIAIATFNGVFWDCSTYFPVSYQVRMTVKGPKGTACW